MSESKRGPVLVVDDSQPVLRLLSTVLGSWSYEVEAANSAREALEIVSRRSFDAIITDINMPEINGVELMRRVRGLDADVPIILLTASPSLDSAIQGIEYGAFKYLTKPIDFEQLRETIERATSLGRLVRFKREAAEVARRESAQARELSLSETFDRALSSLWMAYQPVVATTTGEVIGYEALMRLEDRDLAHPGVMLAAAEELGRLEELGRAIRRAAVVPMLAHPDRGLLFVNLHPYDLVDEELWLADSALGQLGGRVVLEITERAGLDGIDDVPGRVKMLREAGYRIAIDDLGAGHSGLSAFALLEPDYVKIDMTLVRDIHRSPLKQRLVRSMTELCRDLGTTVVAEGVEVPEEHQVLCDLGCDLIQGFLIGRPGPPFPSVTWPAGGVLEAS